MKFVNSNIVNALRLRLGEVVTVEGHMKLFFDHPMFYICDSESSRDPQRDGVPIVDVGVNKAYFNVIPLREGGPAAIGRGRIVATAVQSAESPNGLALDRVRSLLVEIFGTKYDVTPAIEKYRADHGL